YGTRVQFDTSPSCLWTPRPGQVTRNNFTGRRVTIDANGLRLVPGAPAAAARTVLCLGNSVTFGYGLADSETYESQIQTRLDGRMPGRWRFLNAGVNGYNQYLVRRRLEELIARGIRPDLILLGFTFNEQREWPGEQTTPLEREKILKGVGMKNTLRNL